MSAPVLKLVAQRVGLGLLLLLAVSVLIFTGTQLLPGDVAQAILGQSATPQALENLRRDLGLNDPAYIRYLNWLGGVVTGDLGMGHVVLPDREVIEPFAQYAALAREGGTGR